jgi:hypothetical protein
MRVRPKGKAGARELCACEVGESRQVGATAEIRALDKS